jgi:hypothetical protein
MEGTGQRVVSTHQECTLPDTVLIEVQRVLVELGDRQMLLLDYGMVTVYAAIS